MSSANKVTVKIYDQEYTISGDKTREQIIQVADRVDGTMRDIASVVQGINLSSLAVLSAVNIADELYSLKANHIELMQVKEQLQKDIEHYIQLWEEAKKSFLQYKEDAQASLEQKDILQKQLQEKTKDYDTLSRATSEKDNQIAELETKIASLNGRLKARTEGENVSVEQIKVLEDKYKEIEGNYFELQMENTQLKSDLDKYRKKEDEE